MASLDLSLFDNDENGGHVVAFRADYFAIFHDTADDFVWVLLCFQLIVPLHDEIGDLMDAHAC